jgi:hypothetical protein
MPIQHSQRHTAIRCSAVSALALNQESGAIAGSV